MESREDELVGGLKNALERGEGLSDAMQSFLNAGYTPQEVELASRKVDEAGAVVKQAVVSPVSSGNKLPTSPRLVEKKKGHKGLIIGLLIALGFIVLALVLLYVFQDYVFA